MLHFVEFFMGSKTAYFCLELTFLNTVIKQNLNRQVKLTLENINFSLV